MSSDQEPQVPGPARSTAPTTAGGAEVTAPDPAPTGRRGGGPGAGPRRAEGTRASHTWVALAAGLFFLIVVLVFILQNLKTVKAHFFWATWSIPLAVDLLLAAVLGGLIMFAAGSLRIVQLRRVARSRAAAGQDRGWSRPPA